MDREQLSELVHRLNDVELAVLLCLVASCHCILTAEERHLSRLQQDLALIVPQTFGLLPAIVQCTATTTLDAFVGALLLGEDARRNITPSAISPLLSPEPDPYSILRRSNSDITWSDSQATANPFMANRRRIANVIVIRDLDTGSAQIQAQVLELMRTRRIITRKSILEAPEQFLIIALLPKTDKQPPLLVHLREEFFISHHHASPDEEDEAEGDEEAMYPEQSDDADSFASVVIRKHPPPALTSPPVLGFPFLPPGKVLVPHAVIASIRAFAADVSINTEIKRYLLDIVVFLRMHRAVRRGITAQATVDFELLVKCLAPLHNFDFATPALVSLAVFKIYSHRIELVQRAEDERSIMWGSSPAAVEQYLKQVDVEAVIEDVLASVKVPL